jgi:hypothetical protein
MDFEWGEGWLGAFSLLLKLVGEMGFPKNQLFGKLRVYKIS